MKNGTVATKIILFAVCVAIVIYFAVNIVSYFIDPFNSVRAYQYTSERAVSVVGYVAREEEVLHRNGAYMYFSRSEGERVSSGGTVALIYDTAQALQDANKLRSLQEQLQQLYYTRTLAAGAQTSAMLEEETTSALVTFQAALTNKDISEVDNEATNLRAAILKRSYAYSGTAELDASIAELENRIIQLSAASEAASTPITAARSGLFSGLVDGWETVLTPESVMTMTPKEYRTMRAATPEGTSKLIYGGTWYFVTLVRSDVADSLDVGEEVALRFQTGLSRELAMTVERISDEDNGQHLLVLATRQDMNLTTMLRQQSAQVVFDRSTGIRVPRNAVRIVWQDVTDKEGNPILDENGVAKQEQVRGVYCIYASIARFKPVDVLWQEDDYMIVVPSAGAESARRLRVGDDVITAATDLYDGKVIS